jgi:polysaccharide biosynthesis transport protein
MNYERRSLDSSSTARPPFANNSRPAGFDSPGLEIRTLIGSLARQYKLVLGIAFFIIIMAVAGITQLKPRYTAEALLVIDERASQLVGLDEAINNSNSLNNLVDTEVKILNSSAVLLAVVRTMELWKDEEFGLSPSITDRLLAAAGIRITEPNFSKAARIEEIPSGSQTELATILGKSMRVSRVDFTSLISVSVTSRSPTKASLIANAVLEAYFDVQIEARIKTAQRAANFLSQRVDELANTIQDVEQRMDRFVLDQSQRVGSPEARAEVSRMREEIRKTSILQSNLALQIVQLRQLKSPGNSQTAGALQSFDHELIKLVEQREELRKGTLADTGQLTINAKLAAIEAQIAERVDNQIVELNRTLSSSDAKVSALRNSVVELFGRQDVPSNVTIQLYRLQREAQNSRQLYDNYSQRLGEVQQKASLAMPNSRVVASAVVPHDPSFPPTGLILVIALTVGLGLGGVGAMIREHLVGGFASAEQLEAVTKCPVLSVIPAYAGEKPHDAILADRFSEFSESIRRLKINLNAMIRTEGPQVVVLTSTEPDEGKSTIAVCLARAYASAGKKALLIDGDVRRASVARLVGISSQIDLSNLAKTLPTSAGSICDALAKESESGLFLLTVTPRKEVTGDYIFESVEFVDLIKAVREIFDVIIIDSPPVGYVVDSKIVSRSSDACVYVVKQNGASQREIMNGVRETLITIEPNPIGVVLNGASDMFGRYGYFGKRYGAYYSDN